MPLRYCENPERCGIFCGHVEDVGEVVLREDVVAVESTTRSSVVLVFWTTMRSWGLASCMCVEDGVQGGPVEGFAEEGLFGTRVSWEEALPMVYDWTVSLVLALFTEVVEVVFAAWLR